MTKPTVKIDVVSDVVCPWCYIGKRRMEKAIQQVAGELNVVVEFHPFELNPHIPEQGTAQKEHLSGKFGGDDRYDQVTGHVTQVAAEEGLTFNFSKQKVTPNTRHAHRIIQYAKTEKKQAEVKEAFMKAYFTDGVDLSKKENLTAVAVSAGLRDSAVKALLDSEEGLAEIEFEEQQHVTRGIRGVPFFIINNKYGLSGAQPVHVFTKVLLDAAQEPVSQV